MSNSFGGSTIGTNYRGNRAKQPGDLNFEQRDPTQYDSQNHQVGDWWIATYISGNNQVINLWWLASLQGNNTSKGMLANWVLISNGTGNILSIAGDVGVATPIAGLINLNSLLLAGSTTYFTATSNVIRFTVTDPVLHNTLIGLNSGNITLTMGGNTALGYNTLHALTTGNTNTSVGSLSSQAVTTGTGNSSFGYGSLSSVTTGSGNTAIGDNTLPSLTTGANNTILGINSGTSYTTSESSNILIGNAGTVSESNTIHIGTLGTGANQQNTTYLSGGNVIITTPASGTALRVNGFAGALAIDSYGSIAIETGDLAIVNGNINQGSTSNDGNVKVIQTLKSRSGGSIVSGDTIGEISFAGYDGNTQPNTGGYTSGAQIKSVSSGTIGTAGNQRIPADLEFWTHKNANAAGPVQRMVINPDGTVDINAADAGAALVNTFTVSGNVASAGDDGAGIAGATALTNVNSTTISTGVGSVKMSTTNAATNSAWIKIYIGTTAYWIPAWTTNSP